MEFTHFLTWLIVLAVVLVGGLAAMTWAYVGAGSVAVLFEAAVPIADLPLEEAMQAFQQGYIAFQQRHYAEAADWFQQSLQQDRSIAETHHNLGLVLTNLRRDREAVNQLVEASQLYAVSGNAEALELLKHQLEALKARS